MAIAFELQVTFGEPSAGQPFFDYVNARLEPVTIRDKVIGIHPAYGSFANPERHPIHYVSIVPKGVGMGVSFDRDEDRVRLNGDELLELSLYLYDCLRGAPQYEGAVAGWEVTGIDPVKDALEGSSFEGQVVPSALADRLGDEWKAFDDTHIWVPLTEMDAF